MKIDLEQDTLKDILDKMVLLTEQSNDTFYKAFHNSQNKKYIITVWGVGYKFNEEKP